MCRLATISKKSVLLLKHDWSAGWLEFWNVLEAIILLNVHFINHAQISKNTALASLGNLISD
jgi:hypothetical protein